jgi:SnoaL-like domain
MNSDLQEMLDHYQITKVLNEYCHGCDRLEQEQMAGVYLEDSWDDHGRNKCPGKQYAKIAIANLAANTNSCSHVMGQSLIRVDGNEAGAETYFIAIVRVPRGEGEALNQIGGRYVDKLQRIDGKWKIKHRICARDWSITLPVTENFLEGVPFVEGQRGGKDPSRAVLGF